MHLKSLRPTARHTKKAIHQLMQNLVIDTSVIVKWLNQDNELHISNADKILKDVQNNNVELFAPELAKYEIGNVMLIGKKISTHQSIIIQGLVYRLPITFVAESLELATETFSIASQSQITYYDASFIALAKQLSATLITENTKHQGKTQEIKVIPLRSY